MREYELIRSKRKTVAIEVLAGGKVIVRSPLRLSKAEIDRIVLSKCQWIDSAAEKQSRVKAHSYTENELKVLKEKAKEIIPNRIKYFSELMGVKPTGVKITGAKKRFGSCSGKNSLCFSLYLMEYPQQAIDYVVVHELAHIKEKNHGKNFYALIEKYMPDYKDRVKILKMKTADTLT